MAKVTHANIHVENGQQVGDSSRMAVHVLPQRGPRTGETLVMFLDLPGAPLNVCGDMLRALQEGYANAPGGVTSALRLAIKLANDRLLNANRGAASPLTGSLTCALVGEESVVLAQCGPALTYVRTSEGAFERIEPQGAAAEGKLGSSQTIDVFFDNVAHQEGTIYVLTGAHSYPQQNDRLVSACMSKGDAETVAAYLNVNVKQSMAGLAFEVDLAEPNAVDEDDEDDDDDDKQVNTAPPVTSFSRQSAPSAKKADAGRPAAPPPQQQQAVGRRPLLTQEAKDGIRAAFGALWDGLATLGERMLPRGTPRPAMTLSQRVRSRQFLAVAAMVLLPIVIVSISVPFYLQISGEAERMEMKRTIQAQIAAAQAARAPNDVREQWSVLQKSVGEYAMKYPEHAAEFSDVQTQARSQLDGLAKIARVQPATIVRFAEAARYRVASSAMGVYALNTANGTASYTPLNDDHTALNGNAVQLQFTDVEEINRSLTDIAWATNSASRWRTEGAVLFGANGVYEYSSATMRASPWKIGADSSARPTAVQAGELYNNVLYLLDGVVGQIWKYKISTDKLTPDAPYFRAPFDALKGAVDLGIDGAVYVLTQNGSVQKFFGAAPQPFAIVGLPEPMRRPTALVVTGGDPERGNVYILDEQAGAVYEFDKRGMFIRQYRGMQDEFVGATDLAVDMARRTGYIVTNELLYTFKLQ